MIRLATLDDVNNLTGIFTEYKRDFFKLYNIEEIINSKFQDIYLYISENNEILGFLFFEKTYEVISILHIYVLESQRRRKIASNLIDYLISDQNDIERIILEVNVNNFNAIELYKKFGFNIINTRKKYYNDEDGYVMERMINREQY